MVHDSKEKQDITSIPRYEGLSLSGKTACVLYRNSCPHVHNISDSCFSNRSVVKPGDPRLQRRRTTSLAMYLY
uniref:Ovule protein n=1 Tax=Steinernema glaseri TaxID=37863 RepID=A0A1I7Z6P4_9BILA